MKHLKLFEKIVRTTTLYSCPDFTIEYNSNDVFCASTKNGSQRGAIPYMADLIRKKSKFLDDTELREIVVRPRDIDSELDYLNLYPEKIKNIKTYRSGPMRNFWDDKTNKNLPIEVFMELTLKYTPKIVDAIRGVKTLGNVIDNFKIIYKHLEEEPIELYIAANKYNL